MLLKVTKKPCTKICYNLNLDGDRKEATKGEGAEAKETMDEPWVFYHLWISERRSMQKESKEDRESKFS